MLLFIRKGLYMKTKLRGAEDPAVLERRISLRRFCYQHNMSLSQAARLAGVRTASLHDAIAGERKLTSDMYNKVIDAVLSSLEAKE